MITSPELGLSDEEKTILRKIIDYTKNNINHRTSDIWGCFSKPQLKKIIKDNAENEHELTFSTLEVKGLKSIKKKLIKLLSSNCYNRCSYCKRPMGNYGWSWHIEHIKCKEHFRDLTFSLNNLTMACVDCNYRKSSRIDAYNLSHKIINPNSKNYKYSNHLKMNIFGTESLIMLKFNKIDDIGTDTYEYLQFKKIEYSTTLRSINNSIENLIMDIEKKIGSTHDTDLESLLINLKDRILERGS
ncbi:HNH endonuclease [Pantoea stewartii]|uniref:HNH endonuclease n=1 Tax=Pantoea stewartii TaxID=66269 RepID=UPI0021D4A096|nr:HNH endonuclease [Pantoea stewartii]MCU7369235.1 HNH endonuclease [Pantoea stewartii]